MSCLSARRVPPADSGEYARRERSAGGRIGSPRERHKVLHKWSMRSTKRQIDGVSTPVMKSPSMRRLDERLKAVAAKDVTVTLIGESGTGKEVLARRVHELSE